MLNKIYVQNNYYKKIWNQPITLELANVHRQPERGEFGVPEQNMLFPFTSVLSTEPLGSRQKGGCGSLLLLTYFCRVL